MSPTTAASDGAPARRQRDLPRRPRAGRETRPSWWKAPAAALARWVLGSWSAATTTAASRSGCSNTASRWPQRIRARGPSGAAELGEGESLRYSAEGGVEAPLGGRLDDLTSWRRGLLVFDEQPLGEVVARLNRYRPGHLLVAPGALAQRRVSGVFRVADLEASLQSISDELGVRSLGLAGVTLLY